MAKTETIGFIGLGVMGGPMSRNMAVKHPGRVLVFDLSEEALAALSDTKAERAASVEALTAEADVIFLSLPGGAQVETVAGLIADAAAPGTAVVDLSTTPVATARKVGEALAAKEIAFADAPVARTREAAQKGALSIMVGATEEVYARIRPMLDYVATDVTHGGAVGAGQVLKLVNNMLVFANTVALSEMMVLGEKAGVDAETLLDAVSKGSGDSFVLRNHGRKAMAPREFPAKAFSPAYAVKDIGYVFELAGQLGLDLPAAETARSYYARAVERGFGDRYFPCVIQLVEDGSMSVEPA
ncbi:NAD(P)-dependent oxidoreductase [Psychromarinibacter sp. C21-152]|uniref:NAD(P)-dependent oxidoreductase n=1 Tax=Psychromarinibacter sediminicola TaxID=3033385 RepID=A0AAE3NQL2_9RHOB|nr:NAD(P)-dependent oxidoreductase [Psychromarinibacter sediminicola]MDF0599130.1 NAD(P)-dependent oxidoreductase [Psychromarinibacter sediminicola]